MIFLCVYVWIIILGVKLNSCIKFNKIAIFLLNISTSHISKKENYKHIAILFNYLEIWSIIYISNFYSYFLCSKYLELWTVLKLTFMTIICLYHYHFLEWNFTVDFYVAKPILTYVLMIAVFLMLLTHNTFLPLTTKEFRLCLLKMIYLKLFKYFGFFSSSIRLAFLVMCKSRF